MSRETLRQSKRIPRGLPSSRLQRSRADRIYDLVNNTILIICFTVVLYPLLYVLSASFSSVDAIYSGRVWLWPVEFTTIAYGEILTYPPILTGYGNTILYTVAGTAINVILTVLAAYPLSRRDLVGGGFVMFLFALTMIFHGGLIPTYLLIRNLGILDTRWAMLLPQAIGVYNLIIARTFFRNSIPDELLDAARIDGASDFQFVRLVVLPLSGAVIAVITLFYAVFHWNSFFDAFIFLSSRRLYPLQIFLREILVLNEIDSGMMIDPQEMIARNNLRELLKYALIVVASVPILCVYPFVQRYFVHGVMLGSIKG